MMVSTVSGVRVSSIQTLRCLLALDCSIRTCEVTSILIAGWWQLKCVLYVYTRYLGNRSILTIIFFNWVVGWFNHQVDNEGFQFYRFEGKEKKTLIQVLPSDLFWGFK